jgi:hypothetical protein
MNCVVTNCCIIYIFKLVPLFLHRFLGRKALLNQVLDVHAGVQTPMNLDSDEDEFQSIPAPSQRHRTQAFNEEPFTYLAFLKEKLSAKPGNDTAVSKVKVILVDLYLLSCTDTVLD